MVRIKVPMIRALILITTERSAAKASEIYKEEGIPLQQNVLAEGTASSEILDMLGLGSTEKRLLITMLPKASADEMLNKLHNELSMSKADGGIGFTVPVTGASSMLMQMVSDQTKPEDERKDEEKTMNNSHTMIAAILNRGFSGDVMKVAREAGAFGGTVVNSRQVASEDASGFWGMSMQEEKEVLLIITEVEKKLTIMKAITEQFGQHSDAKGVVVSMPIDTVMGI